VISVVKTSILIENEAQLTRTGERYKPAFLAKRQLCQNVEARSLIENNCHSSSVFLSSCAFYNS
jgi:hypothetical protein